MKKTSLVIMAAGIGSRFGGGIKQLAPVVEILWVSKSVFAPVLADAAAASQPA